MFNSLFGWLGLRLLSAASKAPEGATEGKWITINQNQAGAASSLGDTTKQLQSYQNHVYKCVTIIKNRVQSLKWKLVYVKGTEEADVENHPFYDLTRHPNSVWSFRQMIEFWIMHLDLTGRAFSLINLNGVGRPVEIWPLMPSNFSDLIFEPGSLNITGYKFFKLEPGTNIVKPVIYPREMIVDFRYPHPVDLFAGASPIQQMAFAYDLDLAMRTYQRDFFLNNARPDLIFESDDPINKDAAKRFLAEWDARYKGLNNQWKPAMLGDGLKAHILQQSASDLELLGLMGFSKEDILEAYNVPPGKLGTIKDVNKANQHAIDLAFNEECIQPRLMLLAEVLTTQAIQKYDPNLVFRFENPIPSDKSFKLEERTANLGSGYTTINEEREADGLEAVPWGDEPWFPLSLTQPSNPGALRGQSVNNQDTSGKGITKNPEQIQAIHERRMIKWGRVYEKEYLKWLAKIAGEVNANITAVWTEISTPLIPLGFNARERTIEAKTTWDTLNFNLDKATEDFILAMTPVMIEALKEPGSDALSLVGSEISFDLTSPRMLDFLEIRKNLLVGIPNEIFLEIREQIKEALILGESIGAVQQRLIENIWSKEEQVRALKVARTETASVVNRGTLEGYAQSGVVELKAWRSAGDARPTHLEASQRYSPSKAIPLNSEFIVGSGRGLAPGSIGLPEEDISCRCSILPIIGD